MAAYVFVETRDPYESADCANYLALVAGVRARGHDTTLFLVQNGVLAARAGSKHATQWQEAARSGIAVLADAFSLRERAVAQVAEGVRGCELSTLVALLLTPGVKVVWH
jgi:sulfur relay (sulfurtransferase) complex TusBCD TusD component (DsrE family)